MLDRIAELPQGDRELAEGLHALVTAAAPDLAPRTWYGMPAYAQDGKVLAFVQPGSRLGTRYTTVGFNDAARLDDGDLWPTAYAVQALTTATRAALTDLVRRAVAGR
ncbi:MAG TPA: DUF1801 domain-containing protein [Dermatophilaceae bacterium]|nr:DUF1801 domain-containing protein [Dermatophilaceae bacterium]